MLCEMPACIFYICILLNTYYFLAYHESKRPDIKLQVPLHLQLKHCKQVTSHKYQDSGCTNRIRSIQSIQFNVINSYHARPQRMIDAQTWIAPPPPIRTTLHPKPRIQAIKPHQRHPKDELTRELEVSSSWGGV